MTLTTEEMAKALAGHAAAIPDWLSQAGEEEMLAVLSCPALEGRALCRILQAVHVHPGLPVEQQASVLQALMASPLLQTDDAANQPALLKAVWGLAAQVTVSATTAAALSRLYARLPALRSALAQPLEVAQRWLPPGDQQLEPATSGHCTLSTWQAVRMALGRLALAQSPRLAARLLEGDDVALRLVVYACANLSTRQMAQAFSRDGEHAWLEMVHNPMLWRWRSRRQRLHDLAWFMISSQYPPSIWQAELYNALSDRYMQQHPAWFAAAR
ncbi:hypothetical protein [Leeia aquatica]|uniref:Uncharacterized protein n=1 Tax=Leeia aquatica TaxID=2725557 RepID=A0A847RT54_9NEIS|nr:hypothetical protein [Leeia aquatica]NLR74390.1 hypothetical protein [Leeia aquatica]